RNVANGFEALFMNNTGLDNVASGFEALPSNTTGSGNVAIGREALAHIMSGSFNTAIGYLAGGSLTFGDNNIIIGNSGVYTESNTIRIGSTSPPVHSSTFIAGISGTAVTGTGVVVDGNGQLGVAPSSARFKDDIKPMNKASEAVLSLKPVTFRYRKQLDPKCTPQFGL